MKTKYFSFGIDIGGTNTKVALFEISSNRKDFFHEDDEKNIYFFHKEKFFKLRLLDSIKFPTNSKTSNSEQFIKELSENCDFILNKNNLSKSKDIAFSFATPGFPDNINKKVIGGSFNIPFLSKINFLESINKYINNPLYISMINDVTAQGYFEQVKNEKLFKNDNDIILLIALGTGIGGAILSKYNIIIGNDGWAAEFGHIPIWFEKMKDIKIKCTCGKYNCIENFGSVRGYIDILKAKNVNISAEEAFTKYIKNESTREINDATELWLDSLGSLSASLINIFNPSTIIIGGAIAKTEGLVDMIAKRTKIFSNIYLYEKVRFISSSSADLAGAIGCVIHGIKSEYNKINKQIKK